MGESAVRPLTQSKSDAGPRAAPRPLLSKKNHFVQTVLAPIASLRLTVWLFALSLFLIFCGTLAQVDHGIWNVLHKYFQAAVVWIPFQLFVEFAQVFFGLSPKASVGGSFPFPGGLALGSLLLVNLLAAHLVRFQLSWKRAGVLLLHSGLVVMMVSQLYATFFAVEGMMTIEEGRSANYLVLRHATELAIIDPTDPKTDKVIVVPGKRLEKGGVIQSEMLPFDVEVVQYMGNSGLRDLPNDGTENRATTGLGLQGIAAPAKEASGTSSEFDIPSAYLTFKKKGTGETLGTYLVSVWFSLEDRMQQVKVDGKSYDISLRFQRAYKPYAVQLIEFRHDKYIGTDIAKNYSSKIRFTDPTQGVDREVLIRMNEPMRYEGETFYQADFLKDGRKGTVLQVVFNEWWFLPYVSCGLVAFGMLFHFLLHLTRFLRVRFAQ